ncbi:MULTISPECIES: hypothetical protein [unclassified Aureispira]|uniref:hypothetical protein n=1 Tax=unclassified Aureispira TaxID=2649989 RepID=UPI0006975234|nr:MULTISPECIES: hypothetical protein [unclassified Aureispira]WMX14091.1 hypothetical protein QP953_24870 [Aureispira sp. CCB-E]
MRILFLLISISILLASCWDLQADTAIEGFAPGTWRGVFKLEDQAVPVIYEIKNSNNDKPIEFIFKTEKHDVAADSAIIFGDTLFAYFGAANTYLKIIHQVDQMDGFLYDNTGEEYAIPFAGIYGIQQRFPDVRKTPKANLTGEWKLVATIDQDSTLEGTLRISTDGKNKAAASLQFPTYPKQLHLEGTVQDSKIYLSGFDGKTVCWISANIENSKQLTQGNLKLNNKGYFWEAESRAGMMSE